jgi:hypothetical protein
MRALRRKHKRHSPKLQTTSSRDEQSNHGKGGKSWSDSPGFTDQKFNLHNQTPVLHLWIREGPTLNHEKGGKEPTRTSRVDFKIS